MAVILLADESPADRALGRKTLIAAGHSVVEANSVVETLRALAHEDVELIVLDTDMPEAPGGGIIDRVREVRHHVLTPIIALVTPEPASQPKRRRWPLARTEQPPPRSPLADFAVERLPKPFAPHQLVEAVARGLRMRAELGEVHGNLEQRALAFDDWSRLQNQARDDT